MTKRKSPEAQIQRAVVDHLKGRGVPGLVFFHVPNGGGRSKAEGAIFKALGVRAGVSDIIAFHANRFYALELKAAGGRATREQMQFLADADAAGAHTALVEGLDAALVTLESWGLLKPNLSMRQIARNVAEVVG